jgi:hypothetical protein
MPAKKGKAAAPVVTEPVAPVGRMTRSRSESMASTGSVAKQAAVQPTEVKAKARGRSKAPVSIPSPIAEEKPIITIPPVAAPPVPALTPAAAALAIAAKMSALSMSMHAKNLKASLGVQHVGKLGADPLAGKSLVDAPKLMSALRNVAHQKLSDNFAAATAHTTTHGNTTASDDDNSDEEKAVKSSKPPKALTINAKGVIGRSDGASGMAHTYTPGSSLPDLVSYASSEGIFGAVPHKDTVVGSVQRAMDHSVVLNKGVSAIEGLPVYDKRKKTVPKDKRESLGAKWFNMAAQEVTPELKKDLLVNIIFMFSLPWHPSPSSINYTVYRAGVTQP